MPDGYDRRPPVRAPLLRARARRHYADYIIRHLRSRRRLSPPLRVYLSAPAPPRRPPPPPRPRRHFAACCHYGFAIFFAFAATPLMMSVIVIDARFCLRHAAVDVT